MKIAVLPFNAGPNTEPSFARQSSGFVGEVVRQFSGHEVSPVSYMGRADENGMPRFAHINPSETLNDPQMIVDFFEQSDTDKVVDGLLTESGAGSGSIKVRWTDRDSDGQVEKEYSYLPGGMLKALRSLVEDFATNVGVEVPAELATDQGLFGTEDAAAFRNFLIGYDATQYVDRAQGMVLSTFDPQPAMEALLGAAQADRDWEAPYLTLIELARLCTVYRLGNVPKIEKNLLSLAELEPKDARAWFTLGNLYSASGSHDKAAEVFEKAHAVQPEEPAILTRLGQEQFALGMPVNAERTFRKAVDLEGDDKPSMDYLANVLAQTGRAHEVPDLWRSLVAESPQNSQARAKLAVSLLRAGKKDDAKQTFEKAITELKDPAIAKRYYAPVLAEEEDYDRAMDLYEDVLDVAPTDVAVMTEYAQTLSAAGREFEVPKVLRDILNANPDQNTRAMTNAWLLEIEQPKRVEVVKTASEKAEAGDPKSALDELNPLRTWLADYWKLWAVLASVHNSVDEYDKAEEASRKALEIYPACEPVYGELCTSLAGQGREEEAYNLMKVALSNMPNSLMIAINYALAAKRAGDTEEARKMAGQIREFTKDAENLRHILAEIEA
ncbi:MAG TPA: tetratricopeptide repeat protein [Fimbriimonadaceae bacterium]|nr:tetratricopeptide repeat protein [Fimbriimonadaceae bacterium]